MTLVSVIIPAYNVEAYVERAVQSALSQTLGDVEIIVVNDGSTDGTSKALETFEGRIVVCEQENKGLGAARNTGLARANGTYVAFLDGDDIWLPDALATLVQALDEHGNETIAVGDAYLLRDGVQTDETYYGSRPRRLRFRENKQPYWIAQYNFVLGFVACAREAFDRHGLFDEKLRGFEDWDLWLRFIASGARAQLVGRPLGFYRLRGDSLTAFPVERIKDEVSLLESASKQDSTRDIPGLHGRLNFARAKQALAGKDNRRAASLFRLAAADKDLPASTRRRAWAASIVPGAACKLYARQLTRPSTGKPSA